MRQSYRIYYMVTVLLALVITISACTWNQVKRNYDKATDFVFDTGPTSGPIYEEDETPIIELNYDAADEIHADLSNDIPKQSPLFVVRFTNLTDPSDPAPFGKIVAEQLSARLSQLDYQVTAGQPRISAMDVPLEVLEQANATNMAMPVGLALTPSVLRGSYVIGDDVIYMSATVTVIENDKVVAGYQWTLPINKNTRALLPQLRRGGLTPSVQTK